MRVAGLEEPYVYSEISKTVFSVCVCIFYRKSKSKEIRFERCIDESEAQKVMQEMHDGIRGAHVNELMMAKKRLRRRVLLVNNGD